MIKYFTYGSNMDKDDLDDWCTDRGHPLISFSNVTPVMLNGYELVFNYFSTGRNGGAANIMQSPEKRTYGLLVELEESELEIIRVKEGYPRYYDEITIDVITFDGNLISDVITYKVVEEREKAVHQPPTEYYLNLIINAARNYDFPSEYISYLESIEIAE
ncbi:MAG: gamma-glutamylcyclotransferase [Dehalococcoidales bacterium]|nr:MAG: gamma-glutamylcyclotransferase [Dehalococcoidales bacterium]